MKLRYAPRGWASFLASLILAVSVHADPPAATASSSTATPATPPVAGPSTTTPSDDNYRAHYASNKACEDQVAAMRGKPCDIIFIGDSITQGFLSMPTPKWDEVGGPVWKKYYADRKALNFGVGSDKTENVLWRFDHMDVKSFRPKVAVILIGTNNTRNTPEEIAAGVKAVVQKTQATFPGVKIILLSILPNARATEKMADANKIICTFGDDKTVFYLNLAAQMTPVGDSWKGLGKDRLHLSVDGYELWASQMEPLLKRLLAGGSGSAN